MAQIRAEELQEGPEDIDGVLHHPGLPFTPGVIRIKLIHRHHDDSLTNHFGFDKTQELIVQNYYLPNRQKDDEAYDKLRLSAG